MKRTLQTNKKLYALIGQLGIDNDTKIDMILSMSNGRTEHSSELSENEAQRLIDILESNIGKKQRKLAELEQQMRRNVFKLMYDIGLINTNMSNSEKLDYINNWIIGKLKIDKDLNSLTLNEIGSLIKQLQAVRRNYIDRSKKVAMYN
jgi:hypothetical protein